MSLEPSLPSRCPSNRLPAKNPLETLSAMATHTDTKGIHTPAPKGQMLNYYDNNPYAQPKRFHYPTKALLGCGSANSAVVLGAATIIRETTRYLSPVSLLA